MHFFKKDTQTVSYFPEVLMNYMSSICYISQIASAIFKRPPSLKQQYLKIFESASFGTGQLEKYKVIDEVVTLI